MLRAPAGFVPGQPPLFPDAMIEKMREFVPAMKDQIIPGTTHYTLVMGRRGASKIADLVDDFANLCHSS
jgi:hypothetical protein